MNIMKSMLALVMLCTLLFAAGCEKDNASKDGAAPVSEKAAVTEKKDAEKKDSAAKTAEKINIKVYYPDDNGMKLIAETRTIETKGDKYKAAVESLLSGAKAKGAITIIPKKAKIKSVEVKNGIATADFNDDLIKNFTGGSTGEEMLVGSIVNTLTEFPEVKSVQILLDGKKVDSLGGHLDTSAPLKRMTELL